MSFSNNCKPDRMPGPIKGNPLTGMCEKVCVQVDKIFDACMRQETLDNVIIYIDEYVPSTATAPFTFVSGKSSNSEAEVNNLVVTELPDNRGCARVTCDIRIPVTIIALDSAGKTVVCYGHLSVNKDIILHIASESVMPYMIVADATASIPDADFSSQSGELIGTVCVTVIMKVIMKVSLLVPSYGYAYIPPCQEFTQDVCDGIFDLPLYPNDCGCDG